MRSPYEDRKEKGVAARVGRGIRDSLSDECEAKEKEETPIVGFGFFFFFPPFFLLHFLSYFK